MHQYLHAHKVPPIYIVSGLDNDVKVLQLPLCLLVDATDEQLNCGLLSQLLLEQVQL